MLQIHEKDVVVYDDSCPKKVIGQVTLAQRLEMARTEIAVNVAKMAFQPNCDEIPYFKQMGYYDIK